MAKYNGNGTGKILWNRNRKNIMESNQAKYYGSRSGKIHIMESDQAKYNGSGSEKNYGIGSG